MILSRKLLNYFLDFDEINNQTLEKTLNDLGWETEISFDYQDFDKKLIIGKILEKKVHKIMTNCNYCQIDIGNNQTLNILCGSLNLNLNDKVIVAQIGTKLKDGFKIKKRKFHDVYSEGMLCSWAEAGHPWKNPKKLDNVAILPTNAIPGKHPFKTIDLDDCFFKIDIPWNQPELVSTWLIAKYLAKVWNKKIKIDSDEIEFTKTKLPFKLQDHTKKTYQIGIIQINQNNIDVSDKWNLILNEMKLPLKNNSLEKLNQIQTLKWGKELKIIFSEKEIESLEIFEKKILVNNKLIDSKKEINPKFAIIIANDSFTTNPKLNNNFLIKNYSDFIKVLKNDYQLNIKNYQLNKFIEKKQTWKMKVSFINTILGTDFKAQEICDFFKNWDFKTEINSSKTEINFHLPWFHNFQNQNEIISELMRFLDINKIPETHLEIKNIDWNSNIFINNLYKIENYLLNLGFTQIKTPTLIAKLNDNFETPILVVHEREKNQLQPTLISNLLENQKKLNKTVFIIDKIFQNKNNKIEEKTYLGMVFRNEWINDFWTDTKFLNNRTWLIKIIKNIFTIFKLSEDKLFKLQNNSNKKPLWIENDSKISDFNDQGYDEIYYQTHYIGKIGEINFWNKNKLEKRFYLEIDLEILNFFQTKKTKKLAKSRLLSNDQLIFQDFTINLEKTFQNKIYCQVEKQIFVCDHKEHILQKIRSSDKKIIKIKLIDKYKNVKLTFRIWKKTNPIDKISKEKSFEKIEKLISCLNNDKIIK